MYHVDFQIRFFFFFISGVPIDHSCSSSTFPITNGRLTSCLVSISTNNVHCLLECKAHHVFELFDTNGAQINSNFPYFVCDAKTATWKHMKEDGIPINMNKVLCLPV